MRKLDARPARPLESRLAAVLAYLLGVASGIVLLMFEREDRFVRLHALQSIVFSSGTGLVLAMLFLAAPPLLTTVAALTGLCLWLLLIARAWRGEWFLLPFIGAWAERSA